MKRLSAGMIKTFKSTFAMMFKYRLPQLSYSSVGVNDYAVAMPDNLKSFIHSYSSVLLDFIKFKPLSLKDRYIDHLLLIGILLRYY